MTPEQIVDKILPEKHRLIDPSDSQGNWLGETCRYYKSEGHNQCREETRQRLLSTYGKEWVGVPSVEDIARIIWEDSMHVGSWDDFKRLKGFKTSGCMVFAESILKGLRGK